VVGQVIEDAAPELPAKPRVLRIFVVSGFPLRGPPFQADQFSFKLVRLDGKISMCMMLALLAGAALAAYGFFVWRHEKQPRKESTTTMRRTRRAF
jgi:hypothetical protein